MLQFQEFTLILTNTAASRVQNAPTVHSIHVMNLSGIASFLICHHASGIGCREGGLSAGSSTTLVQYEIMYLSYY